MGPKEGENNEEKNETKQMGTQRVWRNLQEILKVKQKMDYRRKRIGKRPLWKTEEDEKQEYEIIRKKRKY